MSIIQGPTHRVEYSWRADGSPVLYVIGHGRVSMAKTALDAIREALRLTVESPYAHVCAVYNLLDVTHLPFLGRFITTGEFPTSPRTAHIVLASNNQAIKLVATLAGVALGSRLRTVDLCATEEEIETAVAHWLTLPERTRAYQIDDI